MQLRAPRVLILKGMVCGPLVDHQDVLWTSVISLILRNESLTACLFIAFIVASDQELVKQNLLS